MMAATHNIPMCQVAMHATSLGRRPGGKNIEHRHHGRGLVPAAVGVRGGSRFSSTRSIRPKATASDADMKVSRSTAASAGSRGAGRGRGPGGSALRVSRRSPLLDATVPIVLSGCLVCLAYSSLSRSRQRSISRAWMAMSLADPCSVRQPRRSPPHSVSGRCTLKIKKKKKSTYLRPARRLVDHDPRVRQGRAEPSGAAREQQRTHRRRLAHTKRMYRGRQVLCPARPCARAPQNEPCVTRAHTRRPGGGGGGGGGGPAWCRRWPCRR